ncbi:glycosyltransferase [Aquibacillus sp. 3ASR75-11]|uniref:Glycosyltransferase n=1 Tax=Terrihalobacillus insolitus TaxID=2950438 RepID=A0A9X3WQN1_9BACI|nr:glycosyltransferase [Terrihalobacillus insolitus]MDC3423480.1 glycosyltransferase [Terrihalobacillus insolitus]
MKIMVFDVPAENGGALSILDEFYNEVRNYKDKNIQWIFVLSKPEFQETANIKVLRFPWLKKSWLHRLFFDHFFAQYIVKKYQPDKVFSLQNLKIPRINIEQIIYVHQSLPFIDYKFSFKENKLFWFYQNILSNAIYKSIKKSKKVIVQSDWFKKACIEKCSISKEKIKVVPPRINVNIQKYFKPDNETLSTFFYPAGASYYKNHRLIVEACEKLKNKNMHGYKVIITIKGNENDHISDLYKRVQEKNLPIYFIGSIGREDVFNYYSKSVLVFPSYIETYGLPIQECKIHRGMILASDTPFSHEILDGYSNAYFFNSFDSESLAKLMENVYGERLEYLEDINLKSNDVMEIMSLAEEIVS